MNLRQITALSLLAIAPALAFSQEMKPAKPDPYVKKADRPAKAPKTKAEVGKEPGGEAKGEAATPVTPKDQRPPKQPRPKAEVGKEPGGEAANPTPTTPKAKQ